VAISGVDAVSAAVAESIILLRSISLLALAMAVWPSWIRVAAVSRTTMKPLFESLTLSSTGVSGKVESGQIY
jgi:hypothetical protein